MPNFIIVDNSVETIGGHHFEYALHVLSAAEAAGYRPVFAVNQKFSHQAQLPKSWQLLPLYRHTAYRIGHLQEEQKRIDADGALQGGGSLWKKVLNVRRLKDRLRWVRYQRELELVRQRFIEDTAAVFARLSLAPGDQVFLPTLCIDDLESLVTFLRSEPRAARVDWHLQFHFRIYQGRPAEYESQESELGGIRATFQQLINALPPDKIHFYTTTEHLARQYNRLGSIYVQTLPYPVNPELLRSQRPYRKSSQLRVTFPGGLRPEKGMQHVFRAIDPLWEEYIESGRLRLIIQAKDLEKLPVELRKHARYDEGQPPLTATPSKVAVVRWPLSPRRYLDLIVQAHIGLLLYDADQYYVRCSGVMVEMLKAGVPVIVPAGCWMADQLAESNYFHHDRLCRVMTPVALLTADAARWEIPRLPLANDGEALPRRDRITADSVLQVPGREAPLCSQVRVPVGATHLCVRFRWTDAAIDGSYLELVLTQTTDGRHQLCSSTQTVGVRAGGQPSTVMIALAEGTRQVQIVWRNAHTEHPLSISHVVFQFVESPDPAAVPLGAVGLIAANIDQVPRLLREMADHYEHYRQSARDFAPEWGNWHSPETVVQQLLATTHQANRRLAPLPHDIVARNNGTNNVADVDTVLRFDLPLAGGGMKLKGDYTSAQAAEIPDTELRSRVIER